MLKRILKRISNERLEQWSFTFKGEDLPAQSDFDKIREAKIFDLFVYDKQSVEFWSTRNVAQYLESRLPDWELVHITNDVKIPTLDL